MRTNFFFFGAKRIGRATAFAFGAAMILALILSFGLQGANTAHAATTFIVNSTGDSEDQSPGDGSCFTGIFIINVGAECTLRAAIGEANALRGADTINFNISGDGPHTISPGSELPPITKRVTIDGYTQNGATKNTLTQPGKTNAALKIELDGNDASNNGLTVGGDASNSVIRGLVINGFRSSGIRIEGVTGIKVEGNFIGTNVAGTASGRDAAFLVYGVTLYDTDNSTIGGTSPEARNLISGNIGRGIQLFDQSTGNKIQGNLIGTDKDGTGDLNNEVGVAFYNGSSNNTVGGVDPDPTDTENPANTIAFNRFDGIEVFEGPVESTGNRILSNSIFSNGDASCTNDCGLGISFSIPIGTPTPNDGDDPNTSKPDPDKDTGPNNLQNYPDITSAQELLFGGTNIAGELNSTPSTRKKKRTFVIQFFSNPSTGSTNEGKTFLGQIQVKTNRQGNAPISFTTEAVSEGEYITATATNKRTGDTSEFSEAERVEPLVIGPAIGGG